MKRIIFLLIIVSEVLGCESTSRSPLDESGLEGTWKWIRTDGGIAFNIHETPESTGFSGLIKFYGDQKYSVYENDRQIIQGKYEILKEKSIYSGELEDYLSIEGSDQIPGTEAVYYLVLSGIMKLDHDTLSIADNYYDGTSSTYERFH